MVHKNVSAWKKLIQQQYETPSYLKYFLDTLEFLAYPLKERE